MFHVLVVIKLMLMIYTNLKVVKRSQTSIAIDKNDKNVKVDRNVKVNNNDENVKVDKNVKVDENVKVNNLEVKDLKKTIRISMEEKEILSEFSATVL